MAPRGGINVRVLSLDTELGNKLAHLFTTVCPRSLVHLNIMSTLWNWILAFLQKPAECRRFSLIIFKERNYTESYVRALQALFIMEGEMSMTLVIALSFFRTEGPLWTGLSLCHKFQKMQIHSLTHILTCIYCFPIIIQIKVIELTLYIKKYCYVKYLYVWCVFSVSLTQSVSHGYSQVYIFGFYHRNLAIHMFF